MAFIKHIGKHSDRKVAIVYRQVPGEEHMALVTYMESIPTHMHDVVAATIESESGQTAKELADALDRALLPDGRNCLHALHREGMIKKVQSNQIVVTPNAQSHVRLDELNKLMGDIAVGGDAAKKLAELDANAGLIDPTAKKQAEAISEATGEPNALDNNAMAANLIAQSEKMAAEAEALVAESKRLAEEAKQLQSADA